MILIVDYIVTMVRILLMATFLPHFVTYYKYKDFILVCISKLVDLAVQLAWSGSLHTRMLIWGSCNKTTHRNLWVSMYSCIPIQPTKKRNRCGVKCCAHIECRSLWSWFRHESLVYTKLHVNGINVPTCINYDTLGAYECHIWFHSPNCLVAC